MAWLGDGTSIWTAEGWDWEISVQRRCRFALRPMLPRYMRLFGRMEITCLSELLCGSIHKLYSIFLRIVVRVGRKGAEWRGFHLSLTGDGWRVLLFNNPHTAEKVNMLSRRAARSLNADKLITLLFRGI